MNSFYKKIYLLFILLVLITSSVSLRPVAHAQSGSISGGYTLLEPLPDLTSGGGGTKDNVQFSEYVDYAFKLFILGRSPIYEYRRMGREVCRYQ